MQFVQKNLQLNFICNDEIVNTQFIELSQFASQDEPEELTFEIDQLPITNCTMSVEMI